MIFLLIGTMFANRAFVRLSVEQSVHGRLPCHLSAKND